MGQVPCLKPFDWRKIHMPVLLACPKCGELCWNRVPSAISLSRSLLILCKGAKCPICDTKVADVITDPKADSPARFLEDDNPVSSRNL